MNPGGWRGLPAKVTVQPGSEGGGGWPSRWKPPAQREEPAQGLGGHIVLREHREARARHPAAAGEHRCRPAAGRGEPREVRTKWRAISAELQA